MNCGFDLDCILLDVNRVTVDLGAERASPSSSAYCETRVDCSKKALSGSSIVCRGLGVCEIICVGSVEVIRVWVCGDEEVEEGGRDAVVLRDSHTRVSQ